MKFLRLLLVFFAVSLTSCSVPQSRYPSVNFIGGVDFVDKDEILKPEQTFKIGINSFSNSDYNLYKFKLFRVSDNQMETVIDSTIDTKIFNAVFTLPTSDKESVERWVFSISCLDGYTTEISTQITTSDTLKNILPSLAKVNRYVMTDLPEKKDNTIAIIVLISVLLNILLWLYFRKDRNKIIITNHNPNKYRMIKAIVKGFFIFIGVIILVAILIVLNFLA